LNRPPDVKKATPFVHTVRVSVHTIRVEFNLNGLNNAAHISGFCGEDGGVVTLNSVSLADIEFSYCQLVRMF
jgi:hypothetical protein